MKPILYFFTIVLLAIPSVAAEPLQLANMSVRMNVSSGQTSIVGFVATNEAGGGDGSRTRILIRAAGPSLRPFGVSHADSITMSVNVTSADTRVLSRWQFDRSAIIAASESVGAFPFTAATGDDAVVVETGAASVTVFVTARSAGDIIVEAYKLRDPPLPAAPGSIKVPQNLVVARALGAGITLVWDGVDEPDLSRYRIYRSTTNQATQSVLIAEQRSGSTFTDTGLATGLRYYYWVTTVLSGSREGGRSNVTSGTANAGI